MPNRKQLNQYYGKYFELCVVARLNQKKERPFYVDEKHISIEDRELMFKEALSVANYLGIQPCIYTGDLTSKASGDIILSSTGEAVEIKRVSASKGTYYNPSQSTLTKYGFDLHDYMDKYYLYNALEDTFGGAYPISKKNWSPVSQKHSTEIRKNWKEIWEDNIVPIDAEMRYHLTQDVIKYFKEHRSDFNEFVVNMITKHSNTSRKSYPNRVIIFNYVNNSIEVVNIPELLSHQITEDATIIDSDARYSFNIKDFRFTICWQNGLGLNNPTIRTYLR